MNRSGLGPMSPWWDSPSLKHDWDKYHRDNPRPVNPIPEGSPLGYSIDGEIFPVKEMGYTNDSDQTAGDSHPEGYKHYGYDHDAASRGFESFASRADSDTVRAVRKLRPSRTTKRVRKVAKEILDAHSMGDGEEASK